MPSATASSQGSPDHPEHLAVMPDVQASRPRVPIAVTRVGISDLRYPVRAVLGDGSISATVARVTLSASLPAHQRGAHLSRFIDALHSNTRELTPHALVALLDDLRVRLDAERAQARFAFPFFLERVAPVSGQRGLVAYDCVLEGDADAVGCRIGLQVRVPVTTLCPCSKEISDYGAHNQRGAVAIAVSADHDAAGEPALFAPAQLVAVAEAAASSPVYSLLKRSDERHVTMAAYEQPVFVEDIVREIADRLAGVPRLVAFRVEAVNSESIHNHDAFAVVEWARS